MLISIMDTSQQKTAGLIMVHATSNGQAVGLGAGLDQAPTSTTSDPTKPSSPRASSPSPTPSQPQAQAQAQTQAQPQPQPQAQPLDQTAASPGQDKALVQGSSEEDVEPYTVTLPPAMLSSSDEETRDRKSTRLNSSH